MLSESGMARLQIDCKRGVRFEVGWVIGQTLKGANRGRQGVECLPKTNAVDGAPAGLGRWCSLFCLIVGTV